MSRNKTAWIVVLLLIGAGAGYHVFWVKWTVGEVEEMIDTAIPLGTAHSEVRDWLMSQSQSGPISAIMLTASSHEPTADVFAEIQSPGARWGFGQRIQIRFQFDVNNRLKVRTVSSYVR